MRNVRIYFFRDVFNAKGKRNDAALQSDRRKNRIRRGDVGGGGGCDDSGEHGRAGIMLEEGPGE